MTTRPLVIAHRGASGYRPEHSRSAYELGIAQGADAIEPDIVATRDGVLVVRHENEISGTTDVAAHPEFASRRTSKSIDGQKLTGWFTEDFTWAELQSLRVRERLPAVRPANTAYDGTEPVLRLVDVLEIAEAASVRVVAEIKHATYFASIGLPLDELFAAEVAGWGGALTLESFEQSVLAAVRGRGVAAPLVFLVENGGTPADLTGPGARSYADHITDAGLARLSDEGMDGVSVDKAILLADPGLPERAHARGLEVFTWTLRPENRFLAKRNRDGKPAEFGDWRTEFAAILATGIDGVFADHPDLAIEARSLS